MGNPASVAGHSGVRLFDADGDPISVESFVSPEWEAARLGTVGGKFANIRVVLLPVIAVRDHFTS